MYGIHPLHLFSTSMSPNLRNTRSTRRVPVRKLAKRSQAESSFPSEQSGTHPHVLAANNSEDVVKVIWKSAMKTVETCVRHYRLHIRL